MPHTWLTGQDVNLPGQCGSGLVSTRIDLRLSQLALGVHEISADRDYDTLTIRRGTERTEALPWSEENTATGLSPRPDARPRCPARVRSPHSGRQGIRRSLPEPGCSRMRRQPGKMTDRLPDQIATHRTVHQLPNEIASRTGIALDDPGPGRTDTHFGMGRPKGMTDRTEEIGDETAELGKGRCREHGRHQMTGFDIPWRAGGGFCGHRDDVVPAIRGEGFDAVFGAVDELFNEGRPGVLAARAGECGFDLVKAGDAKNTGAAGAFSRLDDDRAAH